MLVPLLFFNIPYLFPIQDDLIELVVLPQLGHISDDPDPRVRNMAVQLLVDVAQVCQTQRCQEVLDIIKKVSSFYFSSNYY